MIGVLQQTVRRMVDSHDLRPQYIAECTATYAEPGNINDALAKLRRRHVVVLAGPRGCGRHTSAVWLLDRVGNLTLHEVRREPEENFAIEDLATEDHTGWLLDLRDDDDKVQQSFGRMLVSSGSLSLLEETSSYLTVVIREDLWDTVGIGGEDVYVRLAHAKAIEIVERRLTRGRKSISDEEALAWLRDVEIEKGISDLPPPEAVEWADAICAEHFTPLPTDSIQPGEPSEKILKQKVKNVLAARSNWRDQLLEWHKGHPDIRERCFMLTAAVLEDMSVGQIFTSSQELAKALDEEYQQAKGLAGPGIIELTSEIGANLSQEETIHFRRAGYSDAILEYFWTDRMPLRENFISWLSTDGALTGNELETAATLGRIGQYVLRWSIRRNKLDLIEKVITAWAGNSKLTRAAEDLMTAAGLDANLGKSMRDRMLFWAKSDQGPIKLIVARACGGPLGDVYPGIMLYRIGCLADAGDPGVSRAVKNAIRSMWGTVRVRERIRKEITVWYSSDNEAKRAAARNSFAAIAGLVDDSNFPIALQTDKGIRLQSPKTGAEDFLVRGWRCIFDRPQPGDESASSFAVWMNTALSSGQAQTVIRDIFSSAVYGVQDGVFNDRRYMTFSHLLYRWEPAGRQSNERTGLRDAFLETILRLDPLRYPTQELRQNGG